MGGIIIRHTRKPRDSQNGQEQTTTQILEFKKVNTIQKGVIKKRTNNKQTMESIEEEDETQVNATSTIGVPTIVERSPRAQITNSTKVKKDGKGATIQGPSTNNMSES